jgi:hypothetical protein
MSIPTPTRLSAAAVQQSLDALKTYTAGSSRGALVALDEAVSAATADPAAARELEPRLLELLDGSLPVEAAEYVCRKLILIGSTASVPRLAGLLREPRVTAAAREVLQLLPGPEAGDALRAALPGLTGLPRVGVLLALGHRREAASVAVVVPLLREPDDETGRAAVGALGEIGTPAAAEALKAFAPRAAAAVRPALADACLVCAGKLAAAGQREAAAGLYRLLNAPEQPAHVRRAAASGQARLGA